MEFIFFKAIEENSPMEVRWAQAAQETGRGSEKQRLGKQGGVVSECWGTVPQNSPWNQEHLRNKSLILNFPQCLAEMSFTILSWLPLDDITL